MSFYYHWVVSDSLSDPPTLTELTKHIQDELTEGSFGLADRIHATHFRQVTYRSDEPSDSHMRAYKVRVTGPMRDIEAIRSNLLAEYGRMYPSKINFPDSGVSNILKKQADGTWLCERGHFHPTRTAAYLCNFEPYE